MSDLTAGQQMGLVAVILAVLLLLLLIIAKCQPRCRTCQGKGWLYADHAVVAGRKVKRNCTRCDGTGVA